MPWLPPARAKCALLSRSRRTEPMTRALSDFIATLNCGNNGPNLIGVLRGVGDLVGAGLSGERKPAAIL
jgi:hypothetical protein